jgi:hypothetical protein
LGRLAPLVLVLWFSLDLLFRFAPAQWFRLHPVTLIDGRPLPNSSFTPNYNAVFRYWEGDGASEANLPPTERRTPLQISVDSLGFRRNPYADPGEPFEVLFLLGRSFLLGAALSDEETLPAIFTRVSGLNAYNGARSADDPVDNLEDLDWLLKRMAGPPSVAVLVILEDDKAEIRSVAESPTDTVRNDQTAEAVAHRVPGLSDRAMEIRRLIKRWWAVSPLRTLSTRLMKSVTDDRLLPNEALRSGRQLMLPDGRPMLFRRYEVLPAQKGRTRLDAERLAEYASWWRSQLAQRGMDTWVLLLPSRYTIYGPWLENGDMLERIRQVEAHMYELERQIRQRGVKTLNALPIYQASVKKQFATGELLFFREDNHWKPSGVEVIARALADSILSARPGHGPVKGTTTSSHGD